MTFQISFTSKTWPLYNSYRSGFVSGYTSKWMCWMWRPYGMAPEFTGNPTRAIFLLVVVCYIRNLGRSQWPRGLRRRSAAARLLRFWVRIPPGHGFLSVVSVVCGQVEVSTTRLSLVHGSPTDCGASLCVIYKPREWRGPGPLGAVAPKTNKYIINLTEKLPFNEKETVN